VRPISLLALDLDGTLVDSAPDLAHCVDRAIESLGLAPPGIDLTRSWIGDGIEMLLQRALAHSGHIEGDRAAFRAAMERFSSCYRANLFVRSTLYPKVAATLDYLRQRQIQLACVTNKRSAFAEQLLIEAGIRDCFALLLGGDSLPEKKPSPMQLIAAAERLNVAPAQAVMVGDSSHDYRAAIGAGFGFVWARYGYSPAIDAAAGTKLEAIDSFADLRMLIAD
jgi:phosphoglycolate phosphatase